MLDSERLHHAYCLQGDPEECFDELSSFFEEKLRFPTRGNPDFWHGTYATFGIDESRLLVELQGRKALGEGRKVFVVRAGQMTHEAQNALLKIFEEPAPGTHFFLLIDSAERLLPTLRSRLFVVDVSKKRNASSEAKEFCAMGVPERLSFAKEFAEEIAEEKKSRLDAISFVRAVGRHAKHTLGVTKETAPALEEIQKTLGYLQDRSPSVKMLLEHMAITLPQKFR